ncbi:MAG: 6,7-dimethyl-8-ribityllumazine synthase [Muribaculaceae bacterium]|nr:6,7-dimethyl-8-ribityllumazine synthase [Muribaculaceae bacterium]
MSTILNTNGAELEVPAVYNAANFSCDIITAEWNQEITHALRDAALETLLKGGARRENIRLHDVPGTVELVNAAGVLMRRRPDAVIIIGCVIRGDTPHFDYVCQQAAQGAAILNARGETPLIFGVITTDNLRQALDRAGGSLGNKGAEAAVAAIRMANFHASIGLF